MFFACSIKSLKRGQSAPRSTGSKSTIELLLKHTSISSTSWKTYGPMMRGSSSAASQALSSGGFQPYGGIGGCTARQLGSVKPKEGEFWDRNELPKRFRRTVYSEAEMEAIESGGASLF
jgi:hypothetical protein